MSSLDHPPSTPNAGPKNHAATQHPHAGHPDISMPLTAALFLVMAGTGVMLFLQWSPSTVRIAHEWLGLAFLAAALWHLIHHWRGFQNALMRRPTQVTIALVLLGAGLLIALTAHEPGSGEGRHRHWSEGPPAFSAPISLPEDEQSVS